MKIFSVISYLHEYGYKLIDRLLRILYKSRFVSCGSNVRFYPLSSRLVYNHIQIGNDVQIGFGSNFIATIAHILIGNKVLFGPHVTIRGGDHRIDIVGKFIFDIDDSEKRDRDDQDVWIEDDVWIGTNVTILKGVKIGRGSVVAAGAVVTKSIPCYSIAGGVPAKVLKRRFSLDEIVKHEKKLYPANQRLSTQKLL